MSAINVQSFPPAPANSNQNADKYPPDSQAAAILGELGFYATAYGSSKSEEILKEFDKLMKRFTVVNGKVEFEYIGPNGKETTVTLKDPTLTKMILKMKGSFSDIASYAKQYNSTSKDSFMNQILQWMQNNRVNFSDLDTSSQMALIFFMMSGFGGVGDLSAIAADFLGQGEGGPYVDNIHIIAQLLCALAAEDPNFNPEMMDQCLAAASKIPAFKDLYEVYSANYKNWIKNPKEDLTTLKNYLNFESVFFPYYPSSSSHKINAPGLSPHYHNTQKDVDESSDFNYTPSWEKNLINKNKFI